MLLSDEPGAGAHLRRSTRIGFGPRGTARRPRQPYGLGRLPNGIPLDRRMRRLYRAELVAAEDGEAPEPPIPFDPRGRGRFIEWLNEPADGAPVSRYLAALYSARPDVRPVLPDPAQAFPSGARVGRSEEAIPATRAGAEADAAGTLRWKLARRLGRNTLVNEAPAAPVPRVSHSRALRPASTSPATCAPSSASARPRGT